MRVVDSELAQGKAKPWFFVKALYRRDRVRLKFLQFFSALVLEPRR